MSSQRKSRHPRHPFIENLFKLSQQQNPENPNEIIEDAKTIRHELNEAGYSYTGAKASFTYTRKWLSNPTISLKSNEGRRITVNLDAPKSAKSSKFLISIIFCIAYMNERFRAPTCSSGCQRARSKYRNWNLLINPPIWKNSSTNWI